jgi:hypothetical protein
MLTQLIVTLGTVAGILVVGLLAIIPILLDYAPGRRPAPSIVRVGEVAAGGPGPA